MSLRDELKPKLTKKELMLCPNSFDIVGNRQKAVAVVEIDQKLKKKMGVIASAIMKLNKNVISVLNKESPRSGTYRNYKYRIIKGSKDTEVIHNEYGMRFAVDIRKAYFSSRESTERQRCIDLVNEHERIMVFFAGIGPLALALSRNAGHVIGIEINPAAVSYFRKNKSLNKAENVEIVEGDVRSKYKQYESLCDHVFMPLPEKAMNFIEHAMKCVKSGGCVHLYCFTEDATKEKSEIRKAARKMKKKIRFTGIQKVLPYGPGIWKTRIDFSVL